MGSTFVVGVDGSAHSARAVEWCATHAAALEAEVVAVHAVDIPPYVSAMGPYGVAVDVAPLTPEQREELQDVVERDWCKPLADAGVRFRVVAMEGNAARALTQVARAEAAELVVTGRRGRGGIAELVLGSTSHQLSHHLDRPLVIVP